MVGVIFFAGRKAMWTVNFKLECHYFLSSSVIQVENCEDDHPLVEVVFCKATKFL